MMYKKRGNQSVIFEEKPLIRGRGTVVGQKEGEGPLAENFDIILKDDMYGEKSWEKAESKMLKEAMLKAVNRAGITEKDIDVMLSGDLAQPAHVIVIYGQGFAHTFSGSLWSMLDDDRVAGSRLNADRRRLCEKRLGGSLQPFLHGGKAVQDACGAWKSETAVGTVDRDGRGKRGGFCSFSRRFGRKCSRGLASGEFRRRHDGERSKTESESRRDHRKVIDAGIKER